MMQSTARRVATASARRGMSSIPMGRPGLSAGGHPQVTQRDNFVKNFMDYRANPEAIVLVVAVSAVLGLGVWKLAHDAANPDTRFANEAVRHKAERAEAWSNHALHKGPFSRPREILGITPSDPKLHYAPKE